MSSEAEGHAAVTRAADAISGAEFARIADIAYPSTFEHRRRHNEYVFDPLAGSLTPFAVALSAARKLLSTGSNETSSPERLGAAEKAFRRQAFLCVPMWGGWQAPGGHYEYSRRQAEAIRERGVVAVFEAWSQLRASGMVRLVTDKDDAALSMGRTGTRTSTIGETRLKPRRKSVASAPDAEGVERQSDAN